MTVLSKQMTILSVFMLIGYVCGKGVRVLAKRGKPKPGTKKDKRLKRNRGSK